MLLKISTLYFVLVLVSVTLQTENVNYNQQALWGGSCNTGSQQSPININTRILELCPKLNFRLKFQCETVPLIGSGQSFTIKTQSSSYVGINDQTGQGFPVIRLYRAQSYHFHSPSEHTINGIQFDLELHHFHVPLEDREGQNTTFTKSFVNFNTSSYNKSGLFASVVGYLFYADDGPTAIDLDFRADDNGTAQVNMLQLLGATSNQLFYNYRGSATTPECQEKVDWFVYRMPLPLRRSSLEKIKKAINKGKPNNRRIQPRNKRLVRVVGESCSTLPLWR